MGGLWSHTTRATGTTLTANIYNTDFQDVIDNQTPQMTDDYSSTAAQMQSTVDPYPAAVISQPTSLAGELERIRYVLTKMHGQAQWYIYPTGNARGLILPSATGTPQQFGGFREGFAQAWAYSDATGTILSGYNVNSITRTTTGTYAIAWKRAFATGKYVVVGGTIQGNTWYVLASSMKATGVKIRIQDAAAAGGFNKEFWLMAHGRQ